MRLLVMLQLSNWQDFDHQFNQIWIQPEDFSKKQLRNIFLISNSCPLTAFVGRAKHSSDVVRITFNAA